MTHSLAVALLAMSLGCFGLAVIKPPSKINLVALGLFFWVLLRGFSTVYH